jgi:hypothetical protein
MRRLIGDPDFFAERSHRIATPLALEGTAIFLAFRGGLFLPLFPAESKSLNPLPAPKYPQTNPTILRMD